MEIQFWSLASVHQWCDKSPILCKNVHPATSISVWRGQNYRKPVAGGEEKSRVFSVCCERAHNVNLYSVTLGWEFRQHKAVNVGKINENHASGCITMNSALSSPENCCVVPVLLPDNPALISSDTEDDVCSQENLKSMKKLMRCTYKHSVCRKEMILNRWSAEFKWSLDFL